MAEEMTLDEYREALRLVLQIKLDEARGVLLTSRDASYANSGRIDLLEELIEKI